MKLFKPLLIVIVLVLFFSCVKKTSTPKEFLNQNKVSQEVYIKDKSILKKIVLFYIDSTNLIRKPVPESEILSITIDTVFYGSEGKIVFLYLSKNNNPYVVLNKDSVQFVGGCFIAKKNEVNNSLKIIDKLKYSVTTSEIPNNILRDLRIIYLREMDYIDKKYNINDTRFWSSNVWE